MYCCVNKFRVKYSPKPWMATPILSSTVGHHRLLFHGSPAPPFSTSMCNHFILQHGWPPPRFPARLASSSSFPRSATPLASTVRHLPPLSATVRDFPFPLLYGWSLLLPLTHGWQPPPSPPRLATTPSHIVYHFITFYAILLKFI